MFYRLCSKGYQEGYCDLVQILMWALKGPSKLFSHPIDQILEYSTTFEICYAFDVDQNDIKLSTSFTSHPLQSPGEGSTPPPEPGKIVVEK